MRRFPTCAALPGMQSASTDWLRLYKRRSGIPVQHIMPSWKWDDFSLVVELSNVDNVDMKDDSGEDSDVDQEHEKWSAVLPFTAASRPRTGKFKWDIENMPYVDKESPRFSRSSIALWRTSTQQMLFLKPPGLETNLYDGADNFNGDFSFVLGANDRRRYTQWKLIQLVLKKKSISIGLINADESGNGDTNLNADELRKLLENHVDWV